MADIAFACPECGHAYQFADHLAGKRGRCKACRAVFRIPGPSAGSTLVASTTISAAGENVSSFPEPARSVDVGKIVFDCPSCGHGYRLDANLAGKPGRCTACRGVFTIPDRSGPAAVAPSGSTPSRPPANSGTSWMVVIDPGSPRSEMRPGVAPSAGDSACWELDSSEAIPSARRPRTATPPPALPSEGSYRLADGGRTPGAAAGPSPGQGGRYVPVAAGIVAAAVACIATYSLVNWALTPPARPMASEPSEPPAAVVAAAPPEASPPAAVEGGRPESGAPATPQPAGPARQHREVVDALIHAYRQIADGYARIRDADSIRDGEAPIAAGVAELRSASRRGKGLPPLAPADRRALARQSGPELLRAVDRVIVELRRLRATPGLRSDFDRLIDAYSRTREEIGREVDSP